MTNPSDLPDAELEARIRERAFERDLELHVSYSDERGWSADLKSYRDDSDLAPLFALLFTPERPTARIPKPAAGIEPATS